MKDYIVRATDINKQIRAFAAVTTNLLMKQENSWYKPCCIGCIRSTYDCSYHDGANVKGEKILLLFKYEKYC